MEGKKLRGVFLSGLVTIICQFFWFGSVNAQSGLITSMRFNPVNQPISFVTGEANGVSRPLRVQMLDGNGGGEAVTGGGYVSVEISSDSLTGRFDTSTTSPTFTSSSLSLTVSSGSQNSPDFFYKDTNPGTVIFTAIVTDKSSNVMYLQVGATTSLEKNIIGEAIVSGAPSVVTSSTSEIATTTIDISSSTLDIVQIDDENGTEIIEDSSVEADTFSSTVDIDSVIPNEESSLINNGEENVSESGIVNSQDAEPVPNTIRNSGGSSAGQPIFVGPGLIALGGSFTVAPTPAPAQDAPILSISPKAPEEVLGVKISRLDELLDLATLGDNRDSVTELQAELKAAGFFGVNFIPTGWYGPKTQSAVIKYLRSQNKNLLTFLVVRTKRGDQNEFVRSLQGELKAQGFLDQKVRSIGIYGPRTELAVKLYLSSLSS